MKRRHRRYFKLNLMSLFLIAVSFISVTLAWFAYSGIANVNTEVNVKAWYIDISDSHGEKVSNQVIISVDDIYPGMEMVSETLKIQNLGDSDASVKYSIVSARLFDESNFVIEEGLHSSEKVEDMLSHDYPFNINISLSKHYSLSKGEESIFEVSLSWPLDSGNDIYDSEWGAKAYEFQQKETLLKEQSGTYHVRPSIQVVINVTAEQYLEVDSASDPRFNLGDEILYDVERNEICSSLSGSCLSTYIIDVNNNLGQNFVTLLPNPLSSYPKISFNNYENEYLSMTSSWTVGHRRLRIDDIMQIISTDVTESLLIRENISDAIIGNLKYNDRITKELLKVTSPIYNGYYRFHNLKFDFLSSGACYWIDKAYNTEKTFAVKNIDDYSIVYGENNTNECKIIPVIEVNKANLIE